MTIIKAAFALKEMGVLDAAASPQIFMRLIVFEKLDPFGKNPGSAPGYYHFVIDLYFCVRGIFCTRSLLMVAIFYYEYRILFAKEG